MQKLGQVQLHFCALDSADGVQQLVRETSCGQPQVAREDTVETSTDCLWKELLAFKAELGAQAHPLDIEAKTNTTMLSLVPRTCYCSSSLWLMAA